MLKEQLARDLKDAMRAKETVRMSAIRMIQAAITEREKSGGGPASDDDLVQIVAKQAKQRRDSIAQFTEAGRDDLAEREAQELGYVRAVPAGPRRPTRTSTRPSRRLCSGPARRR